MEPDRFAAIDLDLLHWSTKGVRQPRYGQVTDVLLPF
jgi:hypothetical protein